MGNQPDLILISKKRQIFKWLQCKFDGFPKPDDLPPVPFDKQLYDEIEEQDEDVNALEMIKEEDVQLVCYQWFKRS